MPPFQSSTLEEIPAVRTALRAADQLPNTATDNQSVVSEVTRLCQQRLSESPYAAVRQIACHFHEGLLTLRGTVSTYFEKQMAYTTICDVPGAESFVDRIDVIARDSMSDAKQQKSANRQKFS